MTNSLVTMELVSRYQKNVIQSTIAKIYPTNEIVVSVYKKPTLSSILS